MDKLTSNIRRAVGRAKEDFAEGALLRPKTEGDMAFEYGRACGYALGLEAALRIIDEQINKEDEDHDQ